MRTALLLAALTAVASACSTPTPRDDGQPMTAPPLRAPPTSGSSPAFNAKDAARLLGFPAAEIGPCNELMPGLWRVVLKGPDVAPTGARVETFIWLDGARASKSGPSALAAYLRSINAHTLETVDPYAVQVLLEATDGAPPGFVAGAVSGQIDGIGGSVTTRPFGLTLVQKGWTQPVDPKTPPDAGQPPPPPGRLGPPLDMAPPSGPPPGTAPPSGHAPPRVARATLALNADYKGAWTVGLRRPFAQTFDTVLTLPVAP